MSDISKTPPADTGHLTFLTVELVGRYVQGTTTHSSALPNLIKAVYATLAEIDGTPLLPRADPALVPAVPVEKSIKPGYLICLDDGRKFSSLKRHLHTLGMTPQQYRAKWGLPADYPMVAPEYAARRSELAKETGLGRRPAAAVQ